MRRMIPIAGITALLSSVAMVGSAHAQQPNVPGIIGGAVDGDVGGAVGSAMGYGYMSPSGNYYPGSRVQTYGQYSNPYNNPYYNPYYQSRYDQRGYRYPDYQSGPRTSYRMVPSNPSVDDEPYRAVIVNNEDNGATLRFSINGEMYELQPGKQLEFSGRTRRIIRFDRGNGQDVARYTLAEGRYNFAPTKKGWELYRHPLEPAQTSQPAANETAEPKPAEAPSQTVTGATNPAPQPEP